MVSLAVTSRQNPLKASHNRHNSMSCCCGNNDDKRRQTDSDENDYGKLVLFFSEQ